MIETQLDKALRGLSDPARLEALSAWAMVSGLRNRDAADYVISNILTSERLNELGVRPEDRMSIMRYIFFTGGVYGDTASLIADVIKAGGLSLKA
jgi:hypothetical protein